MTIPRQLECVVSRLTIGHVGVMSHLNRLNRRETAECGVNRVEDTVSHYLMHCSRYDRRRRTLFRMLESYQFEESLKNMLGMGEYRCRKESYSGKNISTVCVRYRQSW